MKRNHPLLVSLEAVQPVVWPALESRDIDEAIQDATELTAAAAAGRAIRSASVAANHLQVNLESMHEMLSSLNAAGGLNASQLGLAQLNMTNVGQTLGLPPVSLGISLESFTEEAPLQQVSLEELEQLIVTIEENHADLDADAIDSVDRHCEILKTALPNCAVRLDALIKRAQESSTQGGGQVSGEGIADYLMCGDEFPSDFPDYMDRYVSLGQKICNAFIPAAMKCAEKACELKDACFESEESFSDTTAKGFDATLDPRACFTAEDYETALPGDGPLFATDADYAPTGEGHFAAMEDFCGVNCPCDPADYNADEDAPVELPALSSADVVRTATALRDLVMECDTAQFQEDTAEAAPALDEAARAFSVSYDNASDDVLQAIGNKVVTVSNYLANAKAMAQWTPVCFLTNLTQTINAFIVYAERSLGMAVDAAGEE